MRLLRRVGALYPPVWGLPVVVVVVLAVVSAQWGRTAATITLGVILALVVGWILGAGVRLASPTPNHAATPGNPMTTSEQSGSEGAMLGGADLTDADLSGADLRGLDLRDVNLTRANLRKANLRGARLSHDKGDDHRTTI